MWGIIFLGVSAVFLIAFYSKNAEQIKELLNADKSNAENLSLEVDKLNRNGVVFKSHNSRCAAILHEDQQEFIIITPIGKSPTNIYNYSHSTFKFNDIIESEVIVDNETITRTSRKSQLAGGIVGGLTLGGMGAFIGGLSGKTNSEAQVKNIDIKITLNNLTDPICKINFLNNLDPDTYEPTLNGFKKDSEEYRHAISEVEKWQGMFEVILHNQE